MRLAHLVGPRQHNFFRYTLRCFPDGRGLPICKKPRNCTPPSVRHLHRLINCTSHYTFSIKLKPIGVSGCVQRIGYGSTQRSNRRTKCVLLFGKDVPDSAFRDKLRQIVTLHILWMGVSKKMLTDVDSARGDALARRLRYPNKPVVFSCRPLECFIFLFVCSDSFFFILFFFFFFLRAADEGLPRKHSFFSFFVCSLFFAATL